MANVLIVEPDALARRAIGGILDRASHRSAMVSSVAEAYAFLQQEVQIDLVVTELKLGSDSGLDLVQRLREDPFLAGMPVLVYTGKPERESVRRALSLKVQNVLVKPYREDNLLAEVEKAVSASWIKALFVRKTTEAKPGRRRETLGKLRKALHDGMATLERLATGNTPPNNLGSWLARLVAVAEATGAQAIGSWLQEKQTEVEAGQWLPLARQANALGVASALIGCYLDPETVPEGFKSDKEIELEKELAERKHWLDAFKEDRCPVVGEHQLARELDKLACSPTVDSVAAAFQMAANGHPTSLNPLLDLVVNDPGLTAEILVAANHLKKKGEGAEAEIEDSRAAIGLLGENRLESIGRSLEGFEERFFAASPRASWKQFRDFQLGVSSMARFVCEYLEMPNLVEVAGTAGLLHDLGKLLLLKLHPFAFEAIEQHAFTYQIPLEEAERRYLTIPAREFAALYAEKVGLPRRFISTLSWLKSPEDASQDRILVAVVALAREFCLRNGVGFAGETAAAIETPLEETSCWLLLKRRVYLNFDFKKFERAAYRECLALRDELAASRFRRRSKSSDSTDFAAAG